MQNQDQQISQEDIELFIDMQHSPTFFVEQMWGLRPQALKKEYWMIAKTARLEDYKVEWFEPFVKGKHITWQQWLMLLAVERALAGKGKLRISVESGHGTGKSATLSWLLLWFLFCFENSQVPCTAPTAPQMHDILWKEAKKWLDKMPEPVKRKYEWTSEYIRVVESPQTWFARARTGRKENPEALAGIHSDYVLYLVDEASGVAQEVFNTAEGALTGESFLFIMISNHTRLIGYFHESHTTDRLNWQCLTFDSRESPVVEEGYIERMLQKHGEDSDEFRIRVAGRSPKEELIDDKGYVPLFTDNDLRKTPDKRFVGKKRLGVDPSGEGDDDTAWVVRDQFKAQCVAKEKVSNPKSITQKTLTLMDLLKITEQETTVDSFGEGAGTLQELGLSSKRVNGVNVGEKPRTPQDEALYLNLRAKAYFAMREWVRKGGEFVGLEDFKEELLSIKYTRELSGKIKIMSKQDMRKQGYRSPNVADALMLTFIEDDKPENKAYKQPDWEGISSYEN